MYRVWISVNYRKFKIDFEYKATTRFSGTYIHDIALMQQIIDKSQRATIMKNIEKLYSGLG